MNKKYSTALAAALLAVATATAHADDWTTNLHPYIGADYQLMHYDYQNGNDPYIKQSVNGANLHVGIQPSKYIGAELGYFDTENGKQSGSVGATPYTTKARVQGG